MAARKRTRRRTEAPNTARGRLIAKWKDRFLTLRQRAKRIARLPEAERKQEAEKEIGRILTGPIPEHAVQKYKRAVFRLIVMCAPVRRRVRPSALKFKGSMLSTNILIGGIECRLTSTHSQFTTADLDNPERLEQLGRSANLQQMEVDVHPTFIVKPPSWDKGGKFSTSPRRVCTALLTLELNNEIILTDFRYAGDYPPSGK